MHGWQGLFSSVGKGRMALLEIRAHVAQGPERSQRQPSLDHAEGVGPVLQVLHSKPPALPLLGLAEEDTSKP